jgi:hypothetical protein
VLGRYGLALGLSAGMAVLLTLLARTGLLGRVQGRWLELRPAPAGSFAAASVSANGQGWQRRRSRTRKELAGVVGERSAMSWRGVAGTYRHLRPCAILDGTL